MTRDDPRRPEITPEITRDDPRSPEAAQYYSRLLEIAPDYPSPRLPELEITPHHW
eukprot:CAMPEP_0202743458 /NCGR_PEP_ID=MMETSP1388-20130828/5825_1 /ASSEMBLY_ACC=CAM_ASM_000864 /TAXON_ID=37098 /ORGANISM="Isochrysis sp, Strain CCMP1244" /LENGTH=54 /DNA_ID=CAMNT_0049410485 /DNA_START=192 /DNA_END=356 /DNA_ORIENTATION=-